MRCSKILATSAVIAATTLTASSALAEGCWSRTYTKAHLHKHPNQQVVSMKLEFKDKIFNGHAGLLSIRLRNGKRYHASISCDTAKGGVSKCGVDCDGGLFQVAHRASDGAVLLRPGGSLAFSECGGEPDSFYSMPKDKEHAAFRLFAC
ncbi:MAG: hypothetical protein MRY74_12910 [Neomegalonema sp.]|nr:hypothetical protein [Neomegalonema sp.]